MILLLSNGAGEDSIASRLAQHLSDLPCQAFPLVGAGAAYGSLDRVGPSQFLPSQGLARESWRWLLADLGAGLPLQVVRQFLYLRQTRYSLAVCVGDLFPVVLAGLAGLPRVIFVGTAKSVFHHSYGWLERRALARWTRRCLPRDEPTAVALRAGGVRAEWVGNAMMDELEPLGLELGVTGALALFPGSRQAAAGVLPRLLEIYLTLRAQRPVPGLLALAPGMPAEALARAAPHWRYEPLGAGPGLVGRLHGPGGAAVGFVQGALGDLLAVSQVALGQAGTAHEQAAGAGVPVVACSSSARLGWYRGRQKGLLGDALEVVEDDPRAAAAALARLLDDPTERARRAAVGRERMGPSGGSARMAAIIRSEL